MDGPSTVMFRINIREVCVEIWIYADSRISLCKPSCIFVQELFANPGVMFYLARYETIISLRALAGFVNGLGTNGHLLK